MSRRRQFLIATLIGVLFGIGAAEVAAKSVADATAAQTYFVAEAYWNHRGLDPCNGVLEQRPLRSATLGWGYIGPFPDGAPACSITLNSRVNWREAAAWFVTPGPQPNARELVCAVVTHERGHNLGLEHTRSGIMAAFLTTVPRICRRTF